MARRRRGRKRTQPGIALEVVGAKEVADGLFRAGEQMLDLRPALNVIARNIREYVRAGFETEGASTGRRWRKLKRLSGQRPVGRGKILQRTASLMRSFTERTAPGYVERIEARELHIGSSDFRAWWHQYGTQKMPRRPILRFAGARDDVDELVTRPLEAHVEGAFGRGD